jgi:hypothetical protein
VDEVLHYGGLVAIFAGFFGMGYQSRVAFGVYIAGNLAWTARAYLASPHDWALIALCLGFVVVALNSYRKTFHAS